MKTSVEGLGGWPLICVLLGMAILTGFPQIVHAQDPVGESRQMSRRSAPVPPAPPASAQKFKYKNIAAVKCWMGSYDDDGNYTAGGCDDSTARTMQPASNAKESPGKLVSACVNSGGQILPVPGSDDDLACGMTARTSDQPASAAASEKDIVKMLKSCLPQGKGVASAGGKLACVDTR